MSFLNITTFLSKVKDVFDRFYLQPLSGDEKKDLRNGYIEREVHGAIHASCAALWAYVMHRLLSKLTPDYVTSSMEKISKHFDMDIESLELCILLVIICHDAGRKGEGQDIWENESGNIGAAILEEIGLNKQHARLLARAITLKDNREQYLRELEAAGIAHQDLQEFDYVRLLVNLGDNTDLVRCIGRFDAGYIFETLKTVPGFIKHKYEDSIIQILRDVQQFNHDLHNMLFDCTIFQKKNITTYTLPARTSNVEKVKYEHAKNTFAALFERALNNPAFQPYLTALKIPSVAIYTQAAAFDPFIHGTSSSALYQLQKTDQQVMSPLIMMDDHMAVPLTGEIKKGGFSDMGSHSVREEDTGRTSFAKMVGMSDLSYSLEKVITDYTQLEVAKTDCCLADLNKQLSIGRKCAFSNINMIMIYFTRARQLYPNRESIISDEDFNALQVDVAATEQFFYFTQLLGTYIFPDYDLIDRIGITEPMLYYKQDEMSYETILNRIAAKKIDMKNIVENPTTENLSRALEVIEYKTAFEFEDAGVQTKTTQLFSLKRGLQTSEDKGEHPITISNGVINNRSYEGINKLLQDFILRCIRREFFDTFTSAMQRHSVAFADRSRLFHKLANAPQSAFSLPKLFTGFLSSPFPVILISEASDKIYLRDFREQEYRSGKPLTLGKDIKMIATDTHEHRLQILKYLEHYQLDNVECVLFDDLKQSAITKKKPINPYNQDGVPSLKWLSAKALAKGTVQAPSISQLSIFTSHKHKSAQFETDLTTAAKLVDDAINLTNIDLTGNRINQQKVEISIQNNK